MYMLMYTFASLIILLTHSSSSSQITATEMCVDHKNDIIKQGDRYFPLGTDPCTQCTCLNGKPEMCISVFCSPPENCRNYHQPKEKCCEFVCLDGLLPFNNNNSTIFPNGKGIEPRSHGSISNNLGLRLIASTITSFLILALLLFMIHRLRQRRLLLMIRRLQTRRLEQVNALPGDNGLCGFPGLDHYDFGGSFNEPPPPYTFWKPPEHYIPPGEAPPPYDESFGVTILSCYNVNNRDTNTNNNNNINNMNNNQVQNNNFTNNTTNSIGTSPTSLPVALSLPLNISQNPTVAVTMTQTRDGHTQLQIPFRKSVINQQQQHQHQHQQQSVTLANVSTSPLSPIVDTISSDQCYEHITVVRINGNSTVTNLESCNSNSDTNSTSSCSTLSSPSNCSASTSSSPSTQSTVRLQECSETISRL